MSHYNDNYPPGFDGIFPWEYDDVFGFDFDNPYESTMEFLRENPEEYRPSAKALFIAMRGKIETEDDYYDFYEVRKEIQRAIEDFENDDTVVDESRKTTIRLTESDLKKIISETVKKVLKEGSSFGLL